MPPVLTAKSASRYRFGTLVAMTCIASGLLGACKSEEKPIPHIVAEALPPTPPLDSVIEKVKSGESYAKIVENLGLSEEETSRLRNSIFAHFDNKLYAGQEYRAVLRGEGEERVLERFQMRSRHEPVRFVLNRTETVADGLPVSSLVFSREEVPVRVDTVSMSGSLASSLYEAFQELGEGAQLVHKVTELFAWDIDFFRDPRKGDAFQLLVEKRFDDMGRFIGYGRILSAQYKSRNHAFTGLFYEDAYYNFEGKSMQKMLLKAPLNYSRISSGFSRSRLHPVLAVPGRLPIVLVPPERWEPETVGARTGEPETIGARTVGAGNGGVRTRSQPVGQSGG